MKRVDPAILRLLIFVGGLVVVVLLLVFLGDVLRPLFLGMGIAYLLDPAVSWLARHGVSRPFGAALIALLAVLVVALALALLVPKIVEETQELMTRLPSYVAALRARVAPWIADLESRYPAPFAEVRARLLAAVRENLPDLAARIASWVAGLFASLLGLFLFLLNLVFVPVFAFYLLVDWPRLRQSLMELLPLPYRAVTVVRLREVNQALGSFLRGQLTIALILAAINASGLLLLGVPFGLVVGLIAGFANLIPYMAVVVGLLPALLLCWAEHQDWLRMLAVAGVFTGAQMLEGTVLSPRILSRHVHLHPVVVLLAVIVGGSFFGVLGMLVAVPLVAACQVFVRHWVALYKQSIVYRGEGEETASAAPSAR